MNKKLKKQILVLLVLAFVLVATIIGNKTQIESKAEESSIVRDTELSVDDSGQLIVNRKKVDQVSMGKENAWTIFVYLCGSDLETFSGEATADIKEMVSSNISENVNIIIQTGGTLLWRDSKLINPTKIGRYMVKDDGLCLIEQFNSANMGESDTFKDFISWGLDNYTSEHMGVILWNHGGGSVDGVCFDERNSYDSLSLAELEKGFNLASKKMTDKFEFIGFDACLMSTIETANMLAPYSNYMIASEEMEPGCGWGYTSIINKLSDESDIDTEELGKTVVDSYFEGLVGENAFDGATLSVINLNEIDNVLVELNSFCKSLNKNTNSLEDITKYTKVASKSEKFGGSNALEGYSNMVDMGDFAKNMSDNVSDVEALLAAINEAVVYQKNGTGHDEATGLSMYYPLKLDGMETYNILRNIVTSPYYMEYLDKVLYASKFGTLDNFSTNNWENSEYFYDKNFDYLDLMFESAAEYYQKYKSKTYYKEASFDDKWYSWFSKVQQNNGNTSGALNNMLIDYLESLDNPELTGPILDWFNSQKYIDFNNSNLADDYVSAEYEIVVPNNDSVSILGTIGSADKDLEDVEFDGSWFALADGQFIQAKLIEEGNGLSMYTSPAIVDGKEVTIRFVADVDKNVLVLGAWDGIDENGCAGKGYNKIESGSEITPLYTTINPTTGEVTIENGVKMIATEEKLIESKDVETYTIIVELVDTFGNVIYTTPNMK